MWYIPNFRICISYLEYDKSVEEDVKSDTSGDFENLLVGLLQVRIFISSYSFYSYPYPSLPSSLSSSLPSFSHSFLTSIFPSSVLFPFIVSSFSSFLPLRGLCPTLLILVLFFPLFHTFLSVQLFILLIIFKG